MSVITNLGTNQQSIADNLNPRDSSVLILKQHTEPLQIEEGPSTFSETTIGNSWIVGSSTNGLVGANTATVNGQQQVVGGSGRVSTVTQVQNPSNVYHERFQNNDFEDTGATTAWWSTTPYIDQCQDASAWTSSADATLTDNTTTFVEGSGSINLTKTGTASVSCAMEITKSEKINIFQRPTYFYLYIKDTATLNKIASSNGLRVFVGLDSSNYEVKYYDRSELAVGWNYVPKTWNDDDVTVGTPTPYDTDYYRIEIISTASGDTWSAGDIIVDYLHQTDAIGVYSAGYNIAQSTSIYLGSSTVTRGTFSVEGTGTDTNIDFFLSADGGSNYEEVTLDTEHTFTNTGTDLRWKIDKTSGTAVISVITVSYKF